MFYLENNTIIIFDCVLISPPMTQEIRKMKPSRKRQAFSCIKAKCLLSHSTLTKSMYLSNVFGGNFVFISSVSPAYEASPSSKSSNKESP